MSDPYAILGVSALADDAQIHRAYRSLARTLHPDANPGDAEAAERFSALTEAYELLHDPVRRRAYDLARASTHGPRAARTAPGPTGNASVRGPSARPSHQPRPSQELGLGDQRAAATERDEFAFLATMAKVVLGLVVLFVIAVVIASLNMAPECAPGVDPSFCRPAPSSGP